ncbi:hypothetical protein FK85_26820 [Halorubrum saccharovorum]|uniref:Uncharacterized protein n=1 Tax=Halorubrum saccharovorum TaxID=2248 RepID=A0A0F8D5R8_9EURY|nr:hypothetical protein [Halorubrum saccharovorum]KKF39664.1 hypothetical protein FK85_26820 [Halorubrum saccharovorum]
MAPAYPQLTTYLNEAGTDGYLINAGGEDSNQYYLSGFRAMGNFVSLYVDGEVRLLVPDILISKMVTSIVSLSTLSLASTSKKRSLKLASSDMHVNTTMISGIVVPLLSSDE